jgi:TolA-binding protein
MDMAITDTEIIERRMGRRRGRRELRETTIPSLKRKLRGTKRIGVEMIEEAGRTESRISDLEREMSEIRDWFQTQLADIQTEAQIRHNDTEQQLDDMHIQAAHTQNQLNDTQNQLTETKDELQEMKSCLHTGQTAYNFEEDLARYIYPPGTPVTYDQKLTTVINWLKENRNTPEGREANRKWEKLKNECGWFGDRQQRDVLLEMRKCRRILLIITSIIHCRFRESLPGITTNALTLSVE